MMLRKRLRVAAVVPGLFVLATIDGAAAAPGEPCTVLGHAPGEIISDAAQNEGHSGYFNPGGSHSSYPPFVPTAGGTEIGDGCNPTDNPQPPRRTTNH